MTEDQISPETITAENDPDSSFWPAWSIFFLGVFFAALNWWRMGNRRKAVLFLGIFVVLRLVDQWLSIENRYLTDANLELASALIYIRIFIGLGFALLLVAIIWRDIKNFRASGQTAVPTNWIIVFWFFVVSVIVVIPINMFLYFGPPMFGYCNFPRLQDIVRENERSNHSRLESILLRRNDFDCSIYWWLERDEKTFVEETLQSRESELNGTYGENTNVTQNSFRIDQNIYLFGQPVSKEQFSEFAKSTNSWPGDITGWPSMNLGDLNLHLSYAEARCKDFDSSRWCIVYLAHQSLIVRLSFSGFVNPKLDEYMLPAIQKTAGRLLQYKSDSP